MATDSRFKARLSDADRPRQPANVSCPPDYKAKKGYMWCPYCGTTTKTGYDAYLGCRRCLECGVTQNDYYVRRANGLWV